MTGLNNRRVLLAVSGGIAAYKSADLASKLVQAGVRLDVLLTNGAEQFLRPLTFEALTRRSVHTSLWEPWTAEAAGHVTLAAEIEALVVAPATANVIARLALGLSDDLLGVVNLSTVAPLVIAPAMEHHMFHHPATQGHLATLRHRGAVIVGPETGRLASGASGDGRLASPDAIVDALRHVLVNQVPDGPVRRHIVVTAGGTQEPIDPVRSITNRSSGRMGYAIARAALDQGADVTLITAPSELTPPVGAMVIRVTTAAEMLTAVEQAVHDADVLIMAAAVADFRPVAAAAAKIKKGSLPATTTIDLEPTVDILTTVNRPGLIKVGFAAETERLVENATAKLRAKNLDLIVANEAVRTIGSDSSTAMLITRDGQPEELGEMLKTALATHIIGRIWELLGAANGVR